MVGTVRTLPKTRVRALASKARCSRPAHMPSLAAISYSARRSGTTKPRQISCDYLRARYYDPATAQIVSVDPATFITRALYYYAGDSPLQLVDPTGLESGPPPPLALPTEGPHPYVSGDPSGRPVKLRGGQGYRDCDDNIWKKDPTKREWDVQHRDGSHTNVGEDGRVTHGPDNFPGRTRAQSSDASFDWEALGTAIAVTAVVAIVIVAIVFAPEVAIPALAFAFAF